jgi:hypothetical protein
LRIDLAGTFPRPNVLFGRELERSAVKISLLMLIIATLITFSHFASPDAEDREGSGGPAARRRS